MCRAVPTSLHFAQLISNRLSDGRVLQEHLNVCAESPSDADFKSVASHIMELKEGTEVLIVVVPATTAQRLPHFIGKEMLAEPTFPDLQVKEGDAVVIDYIELTCEIM